MRLRRYRLGRGWHIHSHGSTLGYLITDGAPMVSARVVIVGPLAVVGGDVHIPHGGVLRALEKFGFR